MSAAVEEWLPEATITLAVYTPADLERISGLRTDMQRVWRRRGQLPTLGSGHARFSIQEVVEITFRYAMSKIGIPPSELKLDLAEATRAAKVHAVFAHGGCEVIGPAEVIDTFISNFAEDDGRLGISLIEGRDANSLKPSSYMVLDEWHEPRIVDDPEGLIRGTDELSIVFNLALIGARLVERGRKPVLTVRFPDQPGQRTVRRLTGVGANDS
jgi:hypothetical protein